MYFHAKNPAHPWLATIAIAAPLLLTLGCASPGQPLPPSLHLPGLAERVTAERDGNAVQLAWTTPATTTDKERIKGTVTAVVCLDVNPSASPAESRRPARRAKNLAGTTPNCKAVKSLPLTPVGPGAAEVQLTPELASGPARLVAYRIELENQQQRSAGPSSPAFVVAGAAPAAAGAITITAQRDGALIQWKAQPGGAAMELKRGLLAAAAGPLPDSPAPKKAGVAPFSPSAGKTPSREVLLRAEGADAGGTIDRTVTDGSTYQYVAQRVRTVTLAGQTLELRGEASPPITFVYHDTFPPAPPTGLVLAPGGGFGQPPAIDLSWNANTEMDVVGYNVYRREGASGFVKLTQEPVSAPAFRDQQVEVGRQYTYRVTAVDQRRNESAAGAEVGELMR